MSFNFYKYNKTLKKEITITTTKMMDTILTTFWFIIIHLNNNYKINSEKSKMNFFIVQIIQEYEYTKEIDYTRYYEKNNKRTKTK